jgi:thiosulfate reductase cytochrome b subunit
MEVQKVYLYPLWLRIWHIFNGLGIVVLIATGFIMHWGIHGAVIDFYLAVSLHNITGILVSISYIFFFVGNIIFYNSRYYRIRIKGWHKRIARQANYYASGIFKGEKPPYPVSVKHKFNPLQKYSYFYVMYLILPIVTFTGIGLMYPELIIETIYGYNGVFVTAMVHAGFGFLIFLFLIIHIYAASIGRTPWQNFKSIIDGWHEAHHEIIKEEKNSSN